MKINNFYKITKFCIQKTKKKKFNYKIMIVKIKFY